MADNHHADLYDAIYDIVRKVPKGRVTTYGHIAAAIGMKSGARMVGYAMNNCQGVRPKVPAHRVVNRNGLLTGKAHFGPGEEMAELLRREGVRVTDDQVQEFRSRLWDPALEIGI
jgi:methylated-DNA-protein-cysteine methyltransferase-like protein